MNPAGTSDTSDTSDASQGAVLSNTLRDRLPFLLKVLVCFLLLDGVERIVELLRWVQNQPDVPVLAPSPYYPNIPATLLWVVVHMLLAALLLLRTWWGRVWTQAIFLIHIVFVGHGVVLRHPEVWVYMSQEGRVRVLLTIILDIVVVAYLASPQARRALAR